MSSQTPTQALAKALDALREVPDGSTLLSQNARLMALYLDRYRVPYERFANFALNAHRNASHNPDALFCDKVPDRRAVLESRIIASPMRLFDCAPICDGAAAVVMTNRIDLARRADAPVRMVASSVATDRFRIADRTDPLVLAASDHSIRLALRQTGLTLRDIDFFEIHDAFSIMACLLLESTGFASPGEGWRLAEDGAIAPDGSIPIATRGGLKARGHPIGATALYQCCEIVEQLSGQAGHNQLANPQVALQQSVGGAGSTVITHILAV